MNAPFHNITAGPELQRLIYERDMYRDRCERSIDDAKKLRDLVKAHLANKARTKAIVDAATSLADCKAFAAAEEAEASSYSDLVCTIEDLFLVSGEELGKALS